MTIGGKIYGYPMSVESIGLICNKKLVPQAPENWEDFVKLDESSRSRAPVQFSGTTPPLTTAML